VIVQNLVKSPDVNGVCITVGLWSSWHWVRRSSFLRQLQTQISCYPAARSISEFFIVDCSVPVREEETSPDLSCITGSKKIIHFEMWNSMSYIVWNCQCRSRHWTTKTLFCFGSFGRHLLLNTNLGIFWRIYQHCKIVIFLQFILGKGLCPLECSRLFIQLSHPSYNSYIFENSPILSYIFGDNPVFWQFKFAAQMNRAW